uniref:C2H2-type domain-containing protein n=1 Tax=Oryza meridionalis TaxID=40149 RepID=A0A0E0CBX3_9ORYZ
MPDMITPWKKKAPRHPGVVIEPCNKKEIFCLEDTLYHLTSVALDEAYGLKDSNVKVFVEVNDEKFAIGTLSSKRHLHIKVDFCFKKNFQLFHTSLISKVAFCGYQVKNLGKFTDSEGDESDEEVPPDNMIKEAQKTGKLPAKSAAVAFAMQKAFVKEIEHYEKSKADDDNSERYSDSSVIGESIGDEDSSDDADDEDEGESSDEETPAKNTKEENEPVVTPLKTFPHEMAKIEAPIMDNKTGTNTSKRGSHLQVANPHPAKQAKRTPIKNDTPKRSASYVCNSCKKTFNSSGALKDHSKAKHPATN